MTDEAIAAATVAVQALERDARAYWDTLSLAHGEEHVAMQGVVRQAGALRRSLEHLIVTRATTAPRAAARR